MAQTVKIIFLDVDGVLNSLKWHTKMHEKILKNPTDFKHPNDEIDPDAVSALNRIINATGAKVVVSSVWRNNGLIGHLKRILVEKGFIGEIIGVTGHGCKDCVRGNEIEAWIENNKEITGEKYWEFKNYVILDDDSDMLLSQKDNFIHITGETGLLEKHVVEAIRILNQE